MISLAAISGREQVLYLQHLDRVWFVPD